MYLSTAQVIGQKQSLVITAQLQQAIHLLQMGNQELTSFIEKQSEENPFLTVKSTRAERSAPAAAPGVSGRAGAADDWDRIANISSDTRVSLYSHAAAEVDRLGLSPEDRRIAECFLEALEPSGWLGQPIEEIAFSAAVDLATAERVLGEIQLVEPAGLFARSLKECLWLQAQDKDLLTPVMEGILSNLDLLGNADLKGLARACDVTLDELKRELRVIRSFNPKPGAIYDAEPLSQRPPDLIVTEGEEGWKIDLNRSTLPTVVVKSGGSARLRRTSEETRNYVDGRLSVARWLSRAVAHRNQTTLAIGAEIVKRQVAFFEKGAAHLVPMILRDVADAVGVHESTVSRVTTGILMQTPQGTVPLKMFFNAALGNREADSNSSAAAVRHRIKQLIGGENPKSPLSDDTIVKVMKDEGVTLARRTVAKYRDMLNIPSSVQRRRQAIVSGAV